MRLGKTSVDRNKGRAILKEFTSISARYKRLSMAPASVFEAHLFTKLSKITRTMARLTLADCERDFSNDFWPGAVR